MNSEPQIIRRPRKWPIYLGIFFALLAVLYFVVTSAPFIRMVVLPRVETAIGSKIEVGTISLSPFSQMELRNVKITPKGAEPLAQVDLIRLRYSLWALIGGKIQAHEITVEKPMVTLVERADGTRNLPKLPPSGPKSQAPIALDLHQIQLSNGELSYTVHGSRGVVQAVTVSDLNVKLDQLVTSQPGKLSISGRGGLSRPPTDKVAGKLGGEMAVTLGPDALPKILKGSLNLELTEALGAFRDASGLSLALESDVTETEVRDLRLAFRRAGEELGRLKLAGPYDSSKSEARLDYELSGIDRRVLVLVGGALGYDLGDSSITAKGKVNLLKNGDVVASNGEVIANRFTLGTPAGKTPTTDFRAQYKMEVNLAENTALVESLQLTATDSRGEWFSGTLDRPMNLAWGKEMPGFRPSQFGLKLSRFDLGEWRALLGTNAPTGNLRAAVDITSEKDGRFLKFSLSGAATQLTSPAGMSQLRDGAFEFSGTATVKEFNTFELSRLGFTLKQAETTLATGTVVGDWQAKNQAGGAQVNAEGDLAPLLAIYPVAGLKAQGGRFKLTADSSQKNTGGTLNVILGIEKFSGLFGASVLTNFDSSLQFTGLFLADVLDVQRFNLTLGSALSPGGSFDATGRWDVAKRTGNFDYHLAKFNQTALEPFLAPYLKPNRLKSVGLDASGKAQVNLSEDSSFTTELKIVDLRAEGPDGKITGPLAIGFNLDVAGHQSQLELRKVNLLLGATPRAKNELAISGKLDLATTNASPSTLSIRSDGLDFTPWYQLLAGDSGAKSAPPPVTVPKPEVEPEPANLPVARLTADLDIAKVYLGALTAEKWKGRMEINNSTVTVKPFDLTLNGTPISFTAVANLGVPGWQYDLNFKAPGLDVAPFVDTFQPNYKGKVSGHLSADAAFKGAGITGLGFQKNLNGGFNIYSTNLYIDLAGLQEIKRGQEASAPAKTKKGVLYLVGETFASIGGLVAGGWYNEITRSPIDTVILRGDAGGGKLALKDGLIQSPVLRAKPSGSITFAPILNDSKMDIPVALALRGGIARKFGLSQDTNQYAALPHILTIAGTLGKSDVKVDKLAVAQLLATSGVGGTVGTVLNNVTGGKAGAVTEKIGGVLNAITGAGAKPDPNAPNSPATPTTDPNAKKTTALDLLNALTKPKTTPATNNTSTNTKPATVPTAPPKK